MDKRDRIIAIIFGTLILGTGISQGTAIAHGTASTDEVQTTIQTDLGAQANPEGLMFSLGEFRRWITAIDPELGIPSSYLQAGVGLVTTPAYGRAAVHVEWLAAVFAKLRVEYNHYKFYGTNSSLLSFPSANSPFGSDEIDALDGKEEEGDGSRLLLRPTLYAKAGPLLVVNQTDLAYFQFSGTGPYFLDWTYEVLLEDGDYVVENRTNFLFQIVKGAGEISLFCGPFYEITHAAAADLNRQRVGIMSYWVPWNAVGVLDQPRFFLQVGYNLEDLNRENEYMAAVGMGFDFDL